jgi:hypothetical protein
MMSDTDSAETVAEHAAALLACAIPALSVLAGRKEPGWVRAARVHQRSLEGRIPAETMGIVQRCTAGLPGRTWREAYQSYQAGMFAMAGWVIIGWAVPWPFLPTAAIGLMVTLTALSWAGSALAWITGPPHPPLPVRRALIRVGRGL